MKKIYVTGPLKGINNAATKRNKHNLSRVCRNILLTENLPICPILTAEGWELDPRFPSNDEWWTYNYYVEFMKDCDLFCYLPMPISMYCHRLEIEKKLWKGLKSGAMVTNDVVMKYLLGGRYE